MLSPQLPDYGIYAYWPEAGHGWIHPDDIAIATRLIPSNRVFRRERYDGLYYHLVYGVRRLRVRPTMWLKIRHDGMEMGDRVEVLSEGLQREGQVARISKMRYNQRSGRIEYTLRRVDRDLPRIYFADQLRLLEIPRSLLLKPVN